MNPGAGLIDLGELPHGEQVELDAPWPARWQLRRMRSRGTWQAVGAAAVTALALVTATGGAAPSGPPFALALTVNTVAFDVDQETLYAIQTDGQQGPSTLNAYRLADGAIRWQYPLPSLDGYAWVTDWFGAVTVVAPRGPALTDYWQPERTTRIDPDTGRPLWSHDGSPLGTAGDRMVLTEPIRDEPPMDDTYTPPLRLTAVDLATGAPQWSREMPGDWRHQVATSGSGHLVTMATDGQQLTSYDLTTGEPVASATLEPQEPTSTLDLQVIGSLAILISGVETEPVWTAYDVDTLRQRWTLGSAGEVGSWPYECGELICLDGRAPRAIDPATGRTVWTADWTPHDRDRWFGVVGLGAPELDGYLLVTRTEDGGLEEHNWLTDARTGELVLDLGIWNLAAGGYPVGEVMVDPMVTWTNEGSIWVGRLRRDMSGVDPIGAIDAGLPDIMPYHECTAWSARVLCAVEVVNPSEGMHTWDVTVWRLRG